MSSCIVYGFIDFGNSFERGKYPVLDRRRTAGPGPFRYGYNLAADGIVVGVARDSSLSSCEMRVDLLSTLAEPKDILAWNFCANAQVDRIGSPGLGLPSSMTIRKTMSMGLGSGQGADTVILRRRDAAFQNWTPWYWFPVQDFWDFWGGCNVTFDWQNDYVRPRGLWGDETPAPSYPLVPFPDGTLIGRRQRELQRGLRGNGLRSSSEPSTCMDTHTDRGDSIQAASVNSCRLYVGSRAVCTCGVRDLRRCTVPNT
jgi:hypothetical protein